jgi:hypothetical protein
VIDVVQRSTPTEHYKLSSMMEIPRDVWLYLGQFISDDDLRRLISLNSAFLELGMNARYRDISLHFLEERTIIYLVRLNHLLSEFRKIVGILRLRNAYGSSP